MSQINVDTIANVSGTSALSISSNGGVSGIATTLTERATTRIFI